MENLVQYYIRIADNSLILAHQLGDYCSKAPFLEEDLAITNTALDLIGQTESVYEAISKLTNGVQNERNLVYRRSVDKFLNSQLVEQKNIDFAHIMVRQFFSDNFNFHFYSALSNSKDPFLWAFANKSLKEVTYHLKRSSEWMIRLGDGTKEAHEKTQNAIEHLYPYCFGLFVMDNVDYDLFRKGISVDLEEIKTLWLQKNNEIFYISKLNIPKKDNAIYDGKNGIHTENMKEILNDLQKLHKKIPDAVWL